MSVLNMYAILPYHNSSMNPEVLIKGMDWSRYGPKTGQEKRAIVTQVMFQCFKRVAAELNTLLIGKDDANIELIPLMDETHLHLYMRVPVMAAPHVVLVKIRSLIHKYMKVSELDFYANTYHAVLKPFYFITSFLPRRDRTKQGDERNLSSLVKIFCYESGLNYTGDLDEMKAEQWGQLNVPMSEYYSLFE